MGERSDQLYSVLLFTVRSVFPLRVGPAYVLVIVYAYYYLVLLLIHCSFPSSPHRVP